MCACKKCCVRTNCKTHFKLLVRHLGGREGTDRRPGALGYRLIVLKEAGGGGGGAQTVDTLRLVREKRRGSGR